jgi:hypothetical protein
MLLDFKVGSYIQLEGKAAMPVELHNFVWEEVRLVQVETQPHHIAGVLAEIRNTLENSDCQWEDIYSAYYECQEDGTVTFYEGDCVEAGNPGIWTYVVYDCAAGEEEVVANFDINTLAAALQLTQLVEEIENQSSAKSIQEVEGKPTFEQRLATLEHTVAVLKRQLASIPKSDNWLEKVIGSISDEAAFSESLEYGYSFRHSDKFVNEAKLWKDRDPDNVVNFSSRGFINKVSGKL